MLKSKEFSQLANTGKLTFTCVESTQVKATTDCKTAKSTMSTKDGTSHILADAEDTVVLIIISQSNRTNQ